MRKKLSESGGTNEYYQLILLVVILLFGAFAAYVTQVRPQILKDLLALELDLNNPTVILILGIMGGLVTAGWWAWRQLEQVAELHAKQDVSELLSLGKPMTKIEINDALRPKRLEYRLWGETINDAIDKLASEGRIELDKLKYSHPKKKKTR
jgi:hypothetical protein